MVFSKKSAKPCKGRAKVVEELVSGALEAERTKDILDLGLLDGMSVIGEKFQNGYLFPRFL